MRRTWPATLALFAVACVGGSQLGGASAAGTALLAGGLAAAAIAVTAQVVGTWRIGHSRWR